MAINPRDPANYYFGTPSIAEDDPSGFGLQVVSWHAEEAISRPYWVRLSLRSRDPELKFEDIVNQPGRLTIERGGEKTYLHGIISTFEQGGHKHEWYIYRALLKPRLWTLTLNHQSRVFQHMSVPEIVREILEEHRVPHDIELRESYSPKEYVVQHNESDLAFISRLLAHDGIRFTFSHGEKRETVNIFDSRGQDPWVDGVTEVPFHFAAGMPPAVQQWVYELFFREQSVPGKVRIADYNYRTPTANLTTEQEDDGNGTGEIYEFGHHFKDREEGKRLAQVRQEELSAQKKILAGRSNAIGFRAGHRFTLENHYRSDLNEDYLLVRIRHYGFTPLTMELDERPRQSADDPSEANYRNEFGAVPARVAFRTPRLTIVDNFFSETFFDATFETQLSQVFNVRMGDVIVNKQFNETHGKFNGLIQATIAGDQPYGAVDGEGNYRVAMAYDTEKGASRAIRMAQPYSGAGDAGFHLPTHAGNEVVIGHIDGDPDRPLILGTVPNPDHASPVNSSNSSHHIIRTTARNELLIDDLRGEERIMLHTPNGRTYLNLGHDQDASRKGIHARTDQSITHVAAKTGLMHGSGGLVLSAWPKDGDKHQQFISKAVPWVNLVMGFVIANAKSEKRPKRSPESFKGKIKEVYEADIKKYYNFSGVLNGLKTAQKIHSQLGLLVGSAMDVINYFSSDGRQQTKAESFFDAFFLKDVPDILLTAQGDVSTLTQSAFNVTAGLGISMRSIAGAEMQVADNIGFVAGKGVSTFAYEGGITLLSVKEPVNIHSRKEGVVIRAAENLILDSLGGHVIIRAEGQKSNLLMASQEAHLEATDDINIVSEKQITLEVGQAKLEMKKDGTITLKGVKIVAEGDQEVQLKSKSSTVDVKPTGLELNAGKTAGLRVSGSGDVTLKGMNIESDAKVKSDTKASILSLDAKAMAKLAAAIAKIG